MMKALLSVSFGTSYEDTRAKTIDVINERLAAAFPDRAFYSAWTSNRIVERVRVERGELHDTLEEAFGRLAADGVDDVVVATTCLMSGHEMRKIAGFAKDWAAGDGARTVRVADPLLTSEADRVAMAAAVCEEFSSVPDDAALLLMGHGSPKGPNEVYSQMRDSLAALGHPNFTIATVEGEPVFDDAVSILEKMGASRVVVAPFMFVAGDHAINDMAGDDDQSWANMLAARGFEVEVVMKGLGEYPAVQQLVVDHAKAAACLAE